MENKKGYNMKQKALLGLLLGTVFWMGIGNISLAAEVPVDEAHFPDAAFRRDRKSVV